MSSQKTISVCIPTYEMGGVGHVFLKHSLDILLTQTFKDFDVVISDFSKDHVIKDLCQSYKDKLDLHYFKNTNPIVGMSTNTNNAMQHATGKLLKILFQDDFLYDEHALDVIAKNFDLKKDTWLATGCLHTKDGKELYRPHYPKYSQDIHHGNNTIGSPSVLTVNNDHPLLLDINMKWLVDCDLYKRYFTIYGKPKLTKEIATVIRVGEHQITNSEATEKVRRDELAYVKKKYFESNSGKLKLDNVSIVTVSGLNPASGIQAVQESMKGIDFHEAVVISPQRPEHLPEGMTYKQPGPDDLKSKDPKNTDDYSKFLLYELHKYIDSDFALIVHKNAYVIRPERWMDDFLAFDYIGAPWPPGAHFTASGRNIRIGNGGFSLRSKKLMKALSELNLPFTDSGTGYFHEDGVMCVYYRDELEKHGITFAPVALASIFSLEKYNPDSHYDPFGFHDNFRALPVWPRFRKFLAKYIK